MASQGFEFAYMLDGSNGSPVIRDFTLGDGTVDHLIGDLMIVQSDGYIDAAVAGDNEITCVVMEQVLIADATTDTTVLKCAILTREQVWKCSMNASTTALNIGNTKTVDIVDKNTVSSSLSGGSMCLVDISKFDSDGNILAELVFLDTTFDNAD